MCIFLLVKMTLLISKTLVQLVFFHVCIFILSGQIQRRAFFVRFHFCVIRYSPDDLLIEVRRTLFLQYCTPFWLHWLLFLQNQFIGFRPYLLKRISVLNTILD